VLECLLVDSFTALVRAGVASLDRVAQDGVRVRASAGAASFRRHSTLQECRCEAEKAVHDLRTQLDTDPGAASRKQAAARVIAGGQRIPSATVLWTAGVTASPGRPSLSARRGFGSRPLGRPPRSA